MPLIQAGTNIPVTATGAELGQTEKQGTPFVAIHFVDAAGNTGTGYLYLTEKAEERSIKTLCEVFDFDCNFDTLAGQITGKPAHITVEDETYEGKTFPKVKWINKPRAVTPVAGGFAAQMSARARAIAMKSGITLAPKPAARPAQPTPKPAPAPAPVDEDCPF